MSRRIQAAGVLLAWIVGGTGLLTSQRGLAQNLTYTPTPSLPVGRAPQAITSGDFNGDGYGDLATVNGTSDDVSILLGNGNGTFQSAVSFGVGKIPLALVTEEMDGDGIPDLVVALSGSDQVVVLKGDGTGLFHKLVSQHAGQGTTFLATGDVNGDGSKDVVAVNSGRFGYYPPFNLSLLLNDGKGVLQAPVAYENDGRDGMFPTGVLVEDMTGDAKPDLTVTWSQPSWRSPNGLISILKNIGDGAFSLHKELKPGFTLSAIQGADVNHDGLMDLAITSLFSDSVRVLLQQDGGLFSELDPIKVSFAPVGLVLRDFDGDQELDLVVVNRDSNSLSMLLGDGKGQFVSAGHFGVGATPSGLVVEDFDQDKSPDIATANTNADSVSVLLSGGGAIPLPSISTDLLVFEKENAQTGAQTSSQIVRLSNIGLGLLRIVDMTISGTGASAFSMTDNSCAEAALRTGDSCTLKVAFTADGHGPHHAVLTIQDNGNGSPRLIALKGSGKE